MNTIASNPIAQAYAKHNSHLDTIPYESWRETLLVMRDLLRSAPSHTPIFCFGYTHHDGTKSVRTAGEQLYTVQQRLNRPEFKT